MSIRIAITQRVAYKKKISEWWDCLDQRWASLLNTFDVICLPVPNQPSLIKDWLNAEKVDGFILSGGNNLLSFGLKSTQSLERDNVEVSILEWAKYHHCPVLGICRGMQMLNWFCGGKIGLTPHHIAVRHKIKICVSNHILNNLPDVNSYHSFGITPENLSDRFQVIAYGEDGTIEAISHILYPWHGIMWHPEREVPFRIEEIRYIKNIFRRPY